MTEYTLCFSYTKNSESLSLYKFFSANKAAEEKDAAKDAAKDPAKDAGKDAAKDAGKDAAKDPAKDAAKDPAKDAAKDAAKDPTKDASKDGNAESPPIDNDNSRVAQGWMSIKGEAFKHKEDFPSIEYLDKGKDMNIILNHTGERLNHQIYSKDPTKRPPSSLLFWFRIHNNAEFLYYSSLKTDVNIIQTIYIKDAKNATPDSDDTECFFVTDPKDNEWEICAENPKLKMEFICIIQREKGILMSNRCEEKYKLDLNPQRKVVHKEKLQNVVIIPQSSRSCNEDWNYKNAGNDWECICKEGKNQSPIDLPDPISAVSTPASPYFEFTKVKSIADDNTLDELLEKGEPIKIRYMNNAVRILNANFGKVVLIDGSVFWAEEINFHTPSEHTIKGVRYDMEMQVVILIRFYVMVDLRGKLIGK